MFGSSLQRTAPVAHQDEPPGALDYRSGAGSSTAGVQTTKRGVTTPNSRRIAIAVTKLDQGGSIDVAYQVAHGLQARGHEVEIWFLYAPRPELLESTPGNARIFLKRSPRSPGDYLRMIAALSRALRDFKPAAVHGVMPLASVLGLGAAAIAGVRSRVASQHVPSRTLNPVMRLLDRLAGGAGVYTSNIAVSAAVRDSFVQNGQSYSRRVRVVPNGVEDRWSELTREAARSLLGLPLNVPLVGNIGRLAAQKNQTFLLDIMPLLPEVHLAIAGSGELEPDLRRKTADLQIADRVHFVGFIGSEQVNHLLRALDLFLFPSLFEGMPLALMEAMSAGVPIVASDIPPNREVAADDGSIPPVRLLGIESPQPWAAAARELLEDRQLAEKMGSLARRRAQTFTMDSMISRYEELLLE